MHRGADAKLEHALDLLGFTASGALEIGQMVSASCRRATSSDSFLLFSTLMP
jgi:hypothetical protein